MTLKTLALLMTSIVAALCPTAAADEDATQAGIRSALTQWTAHFNARRADKVCTLFEADARADVRGQPERDYTAICDVLTRSLNDSTRTYWYSSDIKEIVVFGDVAVVRLVWTLIITAKEGRDTSMEQGMDVFHKQPDGTWKITRYMSYEQ